MAQSKFGLFKEVFNKSTARAAVAAYRKIQELHKQKLDPETTDFKALGRLLDGAAVEAMQEVFENQSDFYVEIRGSEGRKDTRRDGIESPDLYGSYGNKNGQIVEIVNDAVEGTAFASRNIPGATSVLTACLNQKNGFVQTGDYDYMSKLFGPPQLRGKISLELSPSENIRIALKELRIHDPLDLTVIVLDRPRNSFEIESAKEAGVNLILIPGGDLIPGLLAVLNPAELSKLKISKTSLPLLRKGKIPQGTKGVLLMGSGGWEEGIVVAAAAKAVGGHAQGRIYSEDKEEIEQAKILEVSELVPADPESILISASPITDDLWFGVSGVDQDFKVRTIAITSQGFEVSE